VRTDGAPLVFGGGQYVILNTGLVLESGKPVKRAYSLTPSDVDGRACITVKRLPGGVGSNHLHTVTSGARFAASGPWGKLLPERRLPAATLVVATDTGITTALGLVERGVPDGGDGANGAPLVLWLRSREETFLDVDTVRVRCAAAGARFSAAQIPPVHHPERRAVAWALIDQGVRAHRAELVLGAGDGAIVHPLRGRAEMRELGVQEVRVECFFNNPERKAP
jgi:ferredoxin-NADP reductase